MKKINNSKRKFAELFAGIGLVRLGFENAGWECVYANDIDSKKRATYIANFNEDHFQLANIWNIEPSELPKSIDLITASFPCTDLSLAGNRSGLSGQQSGTFWAVIKILSSLKRKPKIVMIENVVGFLSSHNGADFVSAVKALNSCNYVVDTIVLDAKHFVAQSRPRLFIICVLEDIAKDFMVRTNKAGILSAWNAILDDACSALRPNSIRNIIKNNSNLKWGFLNIPRPPIRSQSLCDIVETIPPDSPHWWTGDRLNKFLSQVPTKHLTELKKTSKDNQIKYGTAYRRNRSNGTRAEIRLDGLAGCLRTPRGGSSKQIVVCSMGGEIKVRWMTPREYARLQGVPDTFKLPDNNTDAYFGLGDAVCVPAIEWLARNVINLIL